MRELQLTLPDHPRPLYLRLAAALRTSLREGQLGPGELLPSTRRLAGLVGAHRHTVLGALDELVAEGLVEAEPGRGYRVCIPLECPAGAPRSGEGRFQPVREVRFPDPPDASLRYRFPSGQPDLRLFPSAEYFACVREVLRRENPETLLAYADPRGDPELLAELHTYLRRMRGLTTLGQGDEVLVTHGSQEAIYLLAQLLLAPGQVAVVEEVGYPPAWEALRCAGAELAPLPVDREGANPEGLEPLLASGRVGMIYLTPLHQYPTTVTLSLARRQALYQLAVRYNVPLLEDDYDHEFHYRCQPLPPLKAQDPEGMVLYCSTFSKVLYPAARVGFTVVPSALAEPLARLKQVISRQNDTLTQRALALWMREGGFERHLRRMRRTYEKRMGLMLSELRAHARYLEVEPPDGGMCLWVSLGCDAEALAAEAARRDVMVRPTRNFMLREAPVQHVRLGFASPHEEEIREGIRRLCQAAQDVENQERP